LRNQEVLSLYGAVSNRSHSVLPPILPPPDTLAPE
jgi:hypothetical protein